VRGGEAVVEQGEQLGQLLEAWRRSRWRAKVVIGSVPAARPMPRSMRPGKRPLSTLNVSATFRGL
jgi:hypothetical protein